MRPGPRPQEIPAEYRHLTSPNELGKALGISRQRAWQILHREVYRERDRRYKELLRAKKA